MMPINGQGFRRGLSWTSPRFPSWAWWCLVWMRATRWFRPRAIVVAVDPDKGTITVAVQRWSWRRWQWERVRSKFGGAA